MSEPTSVYTYYDLILRVAELAGVAYYGSGSERALIPIDAHDLDRCVRCVKDGIKMFMADAPETGWRWKNRIAQITFGIVEHTNTVDSGSSTTLVDSDLSDTYDADDDVNGYYVYDLTQEIYALITDYATATGTVTVGAWLDYNEATSSLTPAADDNFSITSVKTVHGDKGRYWLPEDFGSVTGQIAYAKDSNRGSRIEWVNEAVIRARRKSSVNDGDPLMAATRYFGKQRRSEILFDPSPSSVLTVEFKYEVGFDEIQIEAGTSNAGDATTLTDADQADLYPNDYFNGWDIYLISGTGKFSYAPVTDYVGATGVFTVADWLSRDGTAGGTDPGSDSVYYVVPAFTKPPADMRFDQAILSACKAQVEIQFEDLQTKGFLELYKSTDLPAAHAADKRTAPRTSGTLGGGGRTIGRNWNNIIVNDVQQ